MKLSCPNDPPCPHGAMMHDIYDHEDQVPACCDPDCPCGKRRPLGLRDGPLTREEYAAARRADPR